MDGLDEVNARNSELQLHHQHQDKNPSTVVPTLEASEEGGGGAAVLLYYKYVHLGEERRSAVKDWYLQRCRAEGLRGRVRVALDGVNCTLGGSLAGLRQHIGSVIADTILQGGDIDFKLSASRGARNSQAALESGFTTLSVKAVKEVVSLGAQGAGLSHLEGGRHVSPQEFHRLLQEETARQRQRANRIGGGDERAVVSQEPAANAAATAAAAAAAAGHKRNGSSTPPLAVVSHADPAAQRSPERRACQPLPPGEAALPAQSCGGAGVRVVGRRGGGGGSGENDMDESGSSATAAPPCTLSNEKEAVLLDVRNVYETSIGHFSAEGVERLDPKTRQFSELPKWVDENVDRLRGKRVLMYCTGGVRCEMASALIRRHCDADADHNGTEVLQLSGGIERYLQAYPSGREGAVGDRGGGGGGGDADAALDGGHQPAPPLGTTGGGRASVQRAGAGSMGGGAEEGFFRGKNFVFDERVSVPETPAGGMAIGHCLTCERPWDDYGSRSRCIKCRMLVLVCDACVMLLAGGGDGDGREAEEEAVVERRPPVQLSFPGPPTEVGAVLGQRRLQAPPPAPPSGDREGQLRVDRGKGLVVPLAATELVCPACRLRG